MKDIHFGDIPTHALKLQRNLMERYPNAKPVTTEHVETIEEYLARGGKVKKISADKKTSSGCNKKSKVVDLILEDNL